MVPMEHNFDVVHPRIMFGAGKRLGIGGFLKTLPCVKRVMVVSDKGVKGLGVLDPIEKTLEDAGLSYVEFYEELAQDPNEFMIADAKKVAKAENVDAFVAVGGGGVLDVAKALAVVYTNDSDNIMDYSIFVGQQPIINPVAPCVCVPTTAGTGSEITNMSLITEKATSRKRLIVDKTKYVPAAAVIDPELTLGLPKGLTASTGMDALSHAAEAYMNKKASMYGGMWAIKCIKLAYDNLREAVFNGSNIVARANMMFAAAGAGASFNSDSLQIGHAISHGIGEKLHVPHGIGCAWGLPFAIRLSAPQLDLERLQLMAEALGVNHWGKTRPELVSACEDSVMQLIKDINIPTPKDLGLGADQFEDAVRGPVDWDQWLLQNGNIEVTEDMVRECITELWAW